MTMVFSLWLTAPIVKNSPVLAKSDLIFLKMCPTLNLQSFTSKTGTV